MMTQRHILIGLSAWALGVTALAGCNDPFKPDTTDHSLEDCAASEEWLLDSGGAYTQTPPVEMFEPLPHPTTECPFYRGGWENFLMATQPDATGKPALVTSAYPTADDVFTPRVKPTGTLSYLGDIKQAGLRETLIDQNGNTLYYSIEVNQAFADFIHQNHLETSKAIQAYPTAQPSLFFPPGVAEFKAAWQLVEGDQATIDAATANYISIKTSIPTLRQTTDPTTGNKTLVEDRTTPINNATLRLLAIHVVFTLPGHPEFIWASFEHTSGPPDAAAADGHRDLAPTFSGENPTSMDPTNHNITAPVSMANTYTLYKGGTPVNGSNASIAEATLNLVGQKFLNPSDMSPQQTSIYRMFPASKSNTTTPDDAVTSLNHNVEQVFAKATANNALPAYDKRGYYRLVGAQWMDKPRFFHNDFPIQNDDTNPYALTPGSNEDLGNGTIAVGLEKFIADIQTNGSDSAYSILAGEDRMSSTAMESFTQAPGNFNNCFTCHNTEAIDANGVPTKRQMMTSTNLLNPGLLNVSHVISNFVLEDCGSNVMTDPATGIKQAVCN